MHFREATAAAVLGLLLATLPSAWSANGADETPPSGVDPTPPPVDPTPPPVDPTPPPVPVKTVHAKIRIGTSVNGRPILAYRLGDPEAKVKAVVLGSMHGDEQAGIAVVRALRQGKPVHGVDLWVVSTINPDGVARHRRTNAHGVDLNRNFPHHWAAITGKYFSGHRPLSEPESRAWSRFLKRVNPRFVVSFHQPLYGIGSSSTAKPLQHRLASGLGLPIRSFNCNSRCHGTMTSWFNAGHKGTAITVEFGARPGARYLRGKATRGTLAAVLGSHSEA